MHDATWLLRPYARHRHRQLAKQDQGQQQLKVLSSLIRQGHRTRFGSDHGFSVNWTIDDYRRGVPLRDYGSFWRDYWQNSFPDLSGCTWPGPVPWLALSSGTSTGTTKFIPVSREMRRSNARAAADLLVHHLQERPASRILAGRMFMLGGSTGLAHEGQGIRSGDLSGIASASMPRLARLRYFPPRDIEHITDWQEKIRLFAECSLETRIGAFAGTPSWMLIFLEELFEIASERYGRRISRICDIYPDLEMLIHGGIAWQPYRERFTELLDGSNAETREVYPASEGFFAIADKAGDDGLRLILDNGIFFEFVPLDRLHDPEANTYWAGDVQPGMDCALAVTTCAGLWRYLVGDTIMVVDTKPLRIRITGRTSQMLSAFGEHVIASEIEQAVTRAAGSIGRTVNDFSVGSLYPDSDNVRGGHRYIVEFAGSRGKIDISGAQVARFADMVDRELCRLNDDYAAHRSGGYGMEPPRISLIPPGGFAAWMKDRGKLGGQNKVPRIITDQDMFDSLCELAMEMGT